MEVPRGRRAGPLRATRATSDEAHGATSVPLLRGLSFELLVFPPAVGIRLRLPATLQSLNRLFTAGGSGWGEDVEDLLRGRQPLPALRVSRYKGEFICR